MASSQAKPIPQTVEAYKKLAQRDLELIEEQRDEIGRLKAKINKLDQKVKSINKWISVKDRQVAQLQNRNDELEAHVERLREALHESTKGQLIHKDSFLAKVKRETPEQSLNEIRAKAVEDAARVCLGNMSYVGEIGDYMWALRDYAKQLRGESFI